MFTFLVTKEGGAFSILAERSFSAVLPMPSGLLAEKMLRAGLKPAQPWIRETEVSRNLTSSQEFQREVRLGQVLAGVQAPLNPGSPMVAGQSGAALLLQKRLGRWVLSRLLDRRGLWDAESGIATPTVKEQWSVVLEHDGVYRVGPCGLARVPELGELRDPYERVLRQLNLPLGRLRRTGGELKVQLFDPGYFRATNDERSFIVSFHAVETTWLDPSPHRDFRFGEAIVPRGFSWAIEVKYRPMKADLTTALGLRAYPSRVFIGSGQAAWEALQHTLERIQSAGSQADLQELVP